MTIMINIYFNSTNQSNRHIVQRTMLLSHMMIYINQYCGNHIWNNNNDRHIFQWHKSNYSNSLDLEKVIKTLLLNN